MSRVLFMCLDASVASLALIPIFLFLNRHRFHDTPKTIRYWILSFYLCAVYAVAGLPTVIDTRFGPNFNLKPFAYMFSDPTNFLNVLLFIPLGLLLPLYWVRFRKLLPTFFFGLCSSLLIELLQMFTSRATDVNDLMTNLLGTLLGWLIARLVLRIFPGYPSGRKTSDLYLICGISFLVMFFIQPLLVHFLFPSLL